MNRPNIVFISTHDTGRHFGCYGHPTVVTPNIDRLAETGVRFTRAFAASAMCSPSRAAMMTGRYPQSNGVMGLVHAPWNWNYHPEEKHFAEIMVEQGYESHLFMFQHECENLQRLGFSHRHCLPAEPEPGQLPPPESHPPADKVADEFSDFCDHRSADADPFYAQVGFFETHHPLNFNGNAGDDSRGVEVPEYYDHDRYYEDFKLIQGLARKADEAVGCMVEALRRNQLLENTILVFTVDHGLPFPRAKTTVYEAGLEVALIISWPGGAIPQGVVDDRLISNIDIVPTLLDIIGSEPRPNMQGLCFTDSLGRSCSDAVREEVYGMMQQECHMSRSIRTDRYKLIRNFEPGRLVELPVGSKPKVYEIPYCQLFDLDADPMEANDLAADSAHQELRKELDGKLLRHLKLLGDPIVDGPVGPPYYHKAASDFLS